MKLNIVPKESTVFDNWAIIDKCSTTEGKWQRYRKKLRDNGSKEVENIH